METRILLVEDDQDLAETLAWYLNLHGIHSVVVHHANAALDALNAWTFHVVVTDLHLPGMTGTELVAAMRTKNFAIPVIAYSGAFLDDATYKQPVFFAILQKPTDPDLLLAAIQRAAITWSAPP